MLISIMRFNKREFQKHCLRGINDTVSWWRYHQIFECQLSVWQRHSCQPASQGLQVWVLLCSSSLSEGGHSKAQIRQSRCANHLVYSFITEVSWRHTKCHSILKSTFLSIVVDCFSNVFLGQCATYRLQCFVAPSISADLICKWVCSNFHIKK